jgi:hypothetical protein
MLVIAPMSPLTATAAPSLLFAPVTRSPLLFWPAAN